jgi:CxxC motif-containing protein
MEEIRNLVLEAPLDMGDVVLQNPAGTECNIIVTRKIEKEI